MKKFQDMSRPPQGERNGREQRERDLAEVKKEWEQEMHGLAATEDGLREMIGGSMGMLIRNDIRWHHQKPSGLRLRVVDGLAGLWEQQTVDQKPKLLISLSELGENEELAKRLVQSWSANYGFAEAQRQLARLSLGTEDVHRRVDISEKNPMKLNIHWAGTFTWNGEKVSASDTPIVSVALTVPGPEYQLGDEEIPEVNAAYATWAKQYLDEQPDHQGDSVVHAGILTLGHSISPTFEYESPDGGTRTGGGERVTHLAINGVKICSVLDQSWKKIEEHLGLNTSDVVVFTRRQITAIAIAYGEALQLGPRGKAAMIDEALQQNTLLVEAMTQAKQEAEAAIAVQKIIDANTRETARYQTEVEREQVAHEGALLQYQAKCIQQANFFPCFDREIQKKIEHVIAGQQERDYAHPVNLARDSAAEIRSWIVWAQGIMHEVNSAIPTAEDLAKREATGEVLANFPRPSSGIVGHHSEWVIEPDGSLRLEDSVGLWKLVEPQELAIAWSKSSNAAENIFTVGKLPIGGLTDAQRDTVRGIVSELAKKWDGVTGFSGRTVSPPVGKGWDLTEVSAGYPSAKSGKDSRSTAFQLTEPQLRTVKPPHLVAVPTVDEALRAIKERAAEAERVKAAAEKLAQEKKERLQAREAALTPEFRKAIEAKLDELDAYFAICSTFPGETEEVIKFRKAIRTNGLDSAWLRQAYVKNDLNTDFVDSCKQKIAGMKTFATRQKITKENGDVWGRIEEKLAKWKTIPTLIEGDADAQSLITEEAISTKDLVIRVEENFLSHAWEKDASPQASLAVVFHEVLEAL